MSAIELKFLVDGGVGRKVEEYLLDNNYDTKTVRSLDQRMPDQDIIRLAALEKRIIITMDKDFGELVYHSGMEHCGILLLRLEDATGSEKQQVMAKILEKYHMSGSFIEIGNILHLKSIMAYLDNNNLVVAEEFMKREELRTFNKIKINPVVIVVPNPFH